LRICPFVRSGQPYLVPPTVTFDFNRATLKSPPLRERFLFRLIVTLRESPQRRTFLLRIFALPFHLQVTLQLADHCCARKKKAVGRYWSDGATKAYSLLTSSTGKFIGSRAGADCGNNAKWPLGKWGNLAIGEQSSAIGVRILAHFRRSTSDIP
jgi:hypothetical protein